MAQIRGHDGRAVEVRYSAGSKVPYVTSWEDNVLSPPAGCPWPSAVLKQVHAYVARKSWFTGDDAAALAVELGRISKFQSLNSEDAVTWSWFGTLGLAEPEDRRAAVRWLYERLDLSLTATTGVHIDQWMRVIHPNAPQSPKGPELDARIDDPGGALIYVEAKWDAVLGTGKGRLEGTKDDQVLLRRSALRAEPALAHDKRDLVVMGVSNAGPDLAIYTEPQQELPLRAVALAWLTWDDLADCDAHPRAGEFRRYLAWKRELTQSPGR